MSQKCSGQKKVLLRMKQQIPYNRSDVQRNLYFRHKYLGVTDSILNALVITQTTYTHDLKIKFGRKCTYAKKIVFFNLLKNSFHIFRLYGILVFTNAIYTVLCRHLESRTYMIAYKRVCYTKLQVFLDKKLMFLLRKTFLLFPSTTQVSKHK